MDADFERDVQMLWALLFGVVLDAEKRLADFVAEQGLTPPQFFVLKTLIEHGGSCAIGQIAREHHLTNATMSGLIQRMASAAPPLVTRSAAAADRRSVLVTITDTGQARFLAVQKAIMTQMNAVLRLLSPQGRRDLLGYVQRYLQIMTEQFPLSPRP
ncbi:MAG: MarR family transcriptional regulator [Chloroflexi bacterium]|nr:MarR family transcriptional regulator [Chloroflexota bacterium]